MRIEKENGFAHIIAHIQPQDCLHQFGVRYHALMDRYQNIIRFSMFGHSHSESLHVTRAMNSTDPISIYIGAGSGTTGGYKNPSFMVVDYDDEYMVPINAHTYMMNLTEANADPDAKPKWFELHDLLKEYSLPDLSPSSMLEFTRRLYNDTTLASQYEWNKNRRTAENPPKTRLHDKSYLCLAASETFESHDCYGTPHIQPLKNLSVTSMFEEFIANWIEIE